MAENKNYENRRKMIRAQIEDAVVVANEQLIAAGLDDLEARRVGDELHVVPKRGSALARSIGSVNTTDADQGEL